MQNEHVHFDDNSQRVASTEDDTPEAFYHRVAQGFALNMATVLELAEVFAEHFGGQSEVRSQKSEVRPLASDLRSPISGPEVMRLFKRGLRMVRCSTDLRVRAFKLDCLVLALNWLDELEGVESSEQLGKVWQVTKQDANKYVNQFRDVLPPGLKVIPAQGGQRKEESRVKFTLKREEQQQAKAQGHKAG